ncbi:MAG TPA: imidazole glycerol phosphate synthase subunit HisH [Saprospiraceae bacterium]|nr:imidazole glycerol phosphate synthase subunit HisH [Saprospiraceae bacterium]
MNLAIIDYNAGNTKSVINALRRLGIEPILTADPELILQADKVILPGVGHAGSAMAELHKRNLVEVIRSVSVPFLGVCVGMQLMMDWSEEGDTQCLSLVEGDIIKFQSKDYKIPQIGWNTVEHNESQIFKDIPQNSYFYFVHSYYLPMNKYGAATTNYIQPYHVAIQKDNLFGVQFHPEKSAQWGEKLLENFLKI